MLIRPSPFLSLFSVVRPIQIFAFSKKNKSYAEGNYIVSNNFSFNLKHKQFLPYRFLVFFPVLVRMILTRSISPNSPVLHCASLLGIIYGVISTLVHTCIEKHGGFALIVSSVSWKLATAHQLAWAPHLFSSHCNQLIISFEWEKTHLISIAENWKNKENSG